VAGYRLLRDKKHRTKNEMLEFFKMKRNLRGLAAAVGEVARPMLEQAGAAELVPAISQGLLVIDPLLEETTADRQELHDAFFEKLRGLLVSRSYHPLFDEQVGSLVRAAATEGMFEIGVAAGRRAKRTGVASGFMAQVPGFPDATIAEILDVREELRDPLGRFRSIVSEFSGRLETAGHEEDVAIEVDDLYRAEVEPVVREIQEAVESNTYLKQLRRETAEHIERTIGTGAVMGFGPMGLADASAVAEVVVGLGAAAVQATVAARRAQLGAAEVAERNHLFFLYKTQRLLDERR